MFHFVSLSVSHFSQLLFFFPCNFSFGINDITQLQMLFCEVCNLFNIRWGLMLTGKCSYFICSSSVIAVTQAMQMNRIISQVMWQGHLKCTQFSIVQIELQMNLIKALKIVIEYFWLYSCTYFSSVESHTRIETNKLLIIIRD